MKSEFLNPNSKPSYALMSTISGHDMSKGSLTYSFCIVNFICFKEQFFEANGINDVTKKRSIFLSAIGPKAYQLLASLIAPEKPGVETYAELKEVRTVCSIKTSTRRKPIHYEWSYILNVIPVLIH